MCDVADGYTFEASFLRPHNAGMTMFLVVLHRPLSKQAPAMEAAKVATVNVGMALLDKTRSVVSKSKGKAFTLPVHQRQFMEGGGYGMAFRRSYVEANCLVDGVLVVLCTVFIVKVTPPLLLLR
ncbi:hypothetical protein GUJ93_ZPchr0009g682 [Zizania palustris]|uniref:Uncharacterized protein n=1 Tax=Zizania palustris TaxID=103762 RepID=A0A8J5RQJ3_ZIZPA|nr:hypothetical protein GUJ93_ZPchr0009g682 [Zizania palustris]